MRKTPTPTATTTTHTRGAAIPIIIHFKRPLYFNSLYHFRSFPDFRMLLNFRNLLMGKVYKANTRQGKVEVNSLFLSLLPPSLKIRPFHPPPLMRVIPQGRKQPFTFPSLNKEENRKVRGKREEMGEGGFFDHRY